MEDAPASCAIGPDERVHLTDPRLRDCALLSGTRITVYYDPPTGAEKMRPTKAAAPAPDAAEFVGPPAPEAQAPVATVAVPATASEELSRLLPAGAEVNGLSIVLALLAVLGGGTAWRFYRQRSREQHELQMRELELRAANGQQQGPECKADAAALRAEVQRLEGRLAEMERQQSSLALSGGGSDLDDRLAKLERAARQATTRSKAAPVKGKRKT